MQAQCRQKSHMPKCYKHHTGITTDHGGSGREVGRIVECTQCQAEAHHQHARPPITAHNIMMSCRHGRWGSCICSVTQYRQKVVARSAAVRHGGHRASAMPVRVTGLRGEGRRHSSRALQRFTYELCSPLPSSEQVSCIPATEIAWHVHPRLPPARAPAACSGRCAWQHRTARHQCVPVGRVWCVCGGAAVWWHRGVAVAQVYVNVAQKAVCAAGVRV